MSYPSLEEKLAALKVTEPTAYELACVEGVGTGAYEIGVQRTADILDEGYEVFMRSSRSQMGVAGDSIVAMFNAQGDLVNASAGTYLHAVIPPIVIKYVLKNFRQNPGIADGDIWYTNDALYGGIHNPDQVAIMPVFFEGELVAWTAALSHTTETGACEPGGMPVSAKSRFDEGMNLPPMKIGHDHVLRNDVIEMFAAFGLRSEVSVTVDLRARCTTADRVRVRLLEMFEREGKDFVTGLFRRMLMEAAQAPASAWPRGPTACYRCATFSDSAGTEHGLMRNCFMTMTKADDTLHIDFTGTSPETGRPTTPTAGGHRPPRQLHLRVRLPRPAISSATFQPIDFGSAELDAVAGAHRGHELRGHGGAPGAMSSDRQLQSAAPGSAPPSGARSRRRWATAETPPSWRRLAVGHAVRGHARLHHQHRGLRRPRHPGRHQRLRASRGARSAGRRTSRTWRTSCRCWCRSPSTGPDSGGAGKYRGGVGTAQLWGHPPRAVRDLHVDRRQLDLPDPAAAVRRYTMCTCPGLSVEGVDIPELLRAGDEGALDLAALLAGKFGGRIVSESYARTARPVGGDEVITLGISTGGTGLRRPDRPRAGGGREGRHGRDDLRLGRGQRLRGAVQPRGPAASTPLRHGPGARRCASSARPRARRGRSSTRAGHSAGPRRRSSPCTARGPTAPWSPR
jgi:acetophenone carboxylase